MQLVRTGYAVGQKSHAVGGNGKVRLRGDAVLIDHHHQLLASCYLLGGPTPLM